MPFSGLVTMVKSNVHAKGQGRRSKVKVTAVKSNLGWFGAFPDHNSSFNSHMTISLYIGLLVIHEGIPIDFQGHPSIFKVTRAEKVSILPRFERFRTITIVWIYIWKWNLAQGFYRYRKISLLFSRSSVEFQGHMGRKGDNLAPIWAFPDDNYS